MTEEGSNIFMGHRALGFVSNHIPLLTRYIHRRKENLAVTCVGRVFHTYGCSKLGLLSVSKIHPADITCIAADAYLVFVAAGKDIYAWRRGTELKHVYRGHARPVKVMMAFGPHLISVDEDSVLKVWDIKTEKLVLELEFNVKDFDITSMAHPATYMNKILLGSEQGRLKLWNLKSCKCVYTFKGWDSPVTALEQAPAVDVVAIGLASGDIVVHNLKFDETIVKFHQDWGPVTGLTFRTDGHPILVSTSSAGHIALWDLEERKLSCQMRDAHAGSVTGARCLPGEPLLVTSSPDNTIKQWIFDMPDGGGRLLRIREGHAAPPTRIRYYGALGSTIMSAGQDSTLRSFSTVTDLLNKSLGVASFNRKLAKKHKKASNPTKMEPITDFTCETTREKEWDNIASVHRDTSVVTTWSYGQQKQGALLLRHDRFKTQEELRNAKATCLCLSFCGNFVFIGYNTGHLDKYNIQSGLHRGEYGNPAHSKRQVRGICTDSLNQVVISGDNKGILKFWRFGNRELIKIQKLGVEISRMDLHRDSSLMAVVLEDFTLVVVDVIAHTVVRKFEGHDNQITDVAFSADSRWIITSSLDCTVKVWDVPSGKLVDHFAFPSAVTSLTMSPRNDFLATSHVDDLGIYLWTNVTLYSHVNLKPLPADYEPKVIQMPLTLQKEGEKDSPMPEAGVDEDMEVDESAFASPEQIAEALITLACLPDSRWKNLLSLDVIKARNKPKTDLIKPKRSAPFFLPTIAGLEPKFDLSKTDETEDNSKVLNLGGLVQLTDFGKALLAAESDQDFGAMLDSLKEKGPSSIDIEITALSPLGGGTLDLMLQFLKMTEIGLRGGRNYEAIEAYLGLFLKKHADVVMEDENLVEALEAVEAAHEKSWTELKRTLVESATLVGFLKNSLIA